MTARSVTLGMLKQGQAEKLKEAGLDYYNHNLDTDKDFYGQVIKSHTHDDRLDTLDQVRDAGINVCSGGIIGMGESRKNRAALIVQLAYLPQPPESVPINNLVPIPGTPLAAKSALDPFEFVRTIAAARITMEVQRDYGIPVIAVAGLKDLMAFIDQHSEFTAHRAPG